MKLYAAIRPKSAPELDGQQSTEVAAEGGTYEQALAGLRAQVPDGWQMLGISRWPSSTPATE